MKEIDPAMFTKSGLMVGLGESREEIMQVMDDLRSARCGLPHHRSVPPADAQARGCRALLDARRVQGARGDRSRQRVPDGLGEPADALVLSRGRGLRAAACRAGSFAPCRSIRKPGSFRTRPTRCTRSSPTWSAIPSSCRGAQASRCSSASARAEPRSPLPRCRSITTASRSAMSAGCVSTRAPA